MRVSRAARAGAVRKKVLFTASAASASRAASARAKRSSRCRLRLPSSCQFRSPARRLSCRPFCLPIRTLAHRSATATLRSGRAKASASPQTAAPSVSAPRVTTAFRHRCPARRRRRRRRRRPSAAAQPLPATPRSRVAPPSARCTWPTPRRETFTVRCANAALAIFACPCVASMHRRRTGWRLCRRRRRRRLRRSGRRAEGSKPLQGTPRLPPRQPLRPVAELGSGPPPPPRHPAALAAPRLSAPSWCTRGMRPEERSPPKRGRTRGGATGPSRAARAARAAGRRQAAARAAVPSCLGSLGSARSGARPRLPTSATSEAASRARTARAPRALRTPPNPSRPSRRARWCAISC